MKRAIFVTLFLALVGTAIGVKTSAQTSSPEQTLLQIERDWEQANAKNDQPALDRVLAPEFVSTDADGVLTTKAQEDADRRAGANKNTAFTQDDYKVHVFGDAAVVTGHFAVKGTRAGKAVNEQSRFTDTFVRRNGRWQAVASHSSRVAKP
jgi:ketosteroid isomerase-like protein